MYFLQKGLFGCDKKWFNCSALFNLKATNGKTKVMMGFRKAGFNELILLLMLACWISLEKYTADWYLYRIL